MLEAVNMTSDAIVSILRHFLAEGKYFAGCERSVGARSEDWARWKEITYVQGC
jgi:hypothetical protein